MPKTRLISPGIANHSLKKNLILNNNYISNDGGDEGISIANDGDVTIGSTDTHLTLTHNGNDYATFAAADTADLTIATVGDGALDSDMTLDIDGDLTVDISGGNVFFKNGNISASPYIKMDVSTTPKIYAGFSSLPMTIASGTNGDLTLETPGSGDVIVDSGGHVEFDGCSVGFDQEEETFSHDPLKNTGGTHDTQVDFRIGNKIYLQMTASMDQINLIFPAVSGNFLLHIWYNGDWSIGDWKVWESDLTAASNTDVLWPGGTQPDHTDSGKDVFSFYWDAETQVCYGVASLAFAVPS